MVPPDIQPMIDKICRCCMCEGAEMNSVFEKAPGGPGDNILLSDMMMACAQIQVFSGDGLPHLLCSTCESKLNTAFEFKTQCEKSDTTLRQLANKPSNSEVLIKSDISNIVSDSEEDNLPLLLRTRTEVITTTDSWICRHCKRTLPSKKALRVHTRLHKDRTVRYCPACPLKYTRLNALLRHLKKHNENGKKLSCAICSSKYSAAENLYYHLEDHRKELIENTEKVKPIKVKIEVKEENEDVRYKVTNSTDRPTEETRIEIKDDMVPDDDTESMDMANDPSYSDNEDVARTTSPIDDDEYYGIKKRKRGRPRSTNDHPKSFPCTVAECGKVLRTNLGLRIHMKTHGITLEPKFRRRLYNKSKEKEKIDMKEGVECEFCDRKFKYKKSYSQHMRLEHGMSDNEESMATFVEFSKDDVAIGENKALKLEKDSVEVQDPSDKDGNIDQQLSLTSNENLTSMIVQEEKEHDDTLTDKPKAVHTCAMCDLTFERANHLTTHMVFHRALLKHKCDMCKQLFHSEYLLKKHIDKHHVSKPYDCDLCNTSFNRGEYLIRHLKAHKSDLEVAVKCSICDTSFTRIDHLARHTKTHLMQDKRHACAVCGKAFNRLDNLKAHQKSHTEIQENPKLHLCVYCGKEFNNSSNMIVHMRRHTGERPYKCSFCEKGFPRSHDLKCHERTHSGEKPYLCTLCGKSFNKSNKLLRHSRVHTGERPYVCNICGRAFTQSNDLSLHMRRHTGARPYACGVCPARFIQSGQLKTHRRNTGHWMDTQPDLKGGHRVEQISGPIEPVPIRFKKYALPKKEVEDEAVDEVIEIEEQPHESSEQTLGNQSHKVLMGIMGNLKLSQHEMQSLIIDSSKLVELQGGGFGIMNIPSAVIQGENGEEIKLKTELGTFNLESIEKEEIVTTTAGDPYPTGSEAYSGVSTSTTFTNAESFGFQTFD